MKIIPAILLLLLSLPLSAQKTVQTEEALWLGFFNQTRFSKHWGSWLDLHFRLREEFVREPGTAIVRFAPVYYLNDDVRLAAGYAFVHHFPEGARTVGQPEHRPWQQVQWFTKGKKVRLMQIVRLEERFRRSVINNTALGEYYAFNYRVRYNAALFLALTRKQFSPKGLQFLLNNEVMVNFGKEIVYNHFDQNRLFLGLVYQVNAHAQIHAGYMNLYQQLPAGNVFKNQHTIRLNYFHNLDLRSAR